MCVCNNQGKALRILAKQGLMLETNIEKCLSTKSMGLTISPSFWLENPISDQRNTSLWQQDWKCGAMMYYKATKRKQIIIIIIIIITKTNKPIRHGHTTMKCECRK